MLGNERARTPLARLATIGAVATVAGAVALALHASGGDTTTGQRSAVCDGATIEPVGRIDDQRLSEASGITMSSTDGGFWAINDKGNRPDLIALSPAGQVVSQVRVNGTRNIDWEDLGSIELGGDRHIVVADIGDNDENRPTIKLFVVEEPSAGVEEAALRSELTVNYPDRPHNAEALLVHPDGTGAVVVRDDEALLYLIDDVTATGPATMRSVGSVWDGAEIRAGTVSVDGSLVALRTESQIRVWEVGSAGLRGLTDAPSCTVDLEQRKPEAMTFRGPSQIVATGEGAAEIFLVSLEAQ